MIPTAVLVFYFGLLFRSGCALGCYLVTKDRGWRFPGLYAAGGWLASGVLYGLVLRVIL